MGLDECGGSLQKSAWQEQQRTAALRTVLPVARVLGNEKQFLNSSAILEPRVDVAETVGRIVSDNCLSVPADRPSF